MHISQPTYLLRRNGIMDIKFHTSWKSIKFIQFVYNFYHNILLVCRSPKCCRPRQPPSSPNVHTFCEAFFILSYSTYVYPCLLYQALNGCIKITFVQCYLDVDAVPPHLIDEKNNAKKRKQNMLEKKKNSKSI